MNQPADDLRYNELKAELRALHEKIAELNNKLISIGSAAPSSRGRVFSKIRVYRWPLSIGFLVLAVVAVAATSDPLSIDPSSGTVRIATLEVAGKNVKQALDDLAQGLNGKLGLAGGQITGDLNVGGAIRAGNSDLYFTRTTYTHTGEGDKEGYAAISNARDYNALMILGRSTKGSGRVVRMWDRVGILGGPGDIPQAALDVKGEIRGRVWYSQQYPWNYPNKATKMTRTDRSVCFLTYVSGKFAGWGEAVDISAGGDGHWYLGGIQGAGGADIKARASCIGAPDGGSW
jgi:hypothetical protein